MSTETSLKDVEKRYPGAPTFIFGDSRELCDELLALVRSGVKTATCGALRDYETDAEALPVVGGTCVALDWDGSPALVIETTDVAIVRFREVETDFALAEGEDEALEGWQQGHKRFFERNGGFDPDMLLVCERFRLVEDLG